jgi:hypothetical protein
MSELSWEIERAPFGIGDEPQWEVIKRLSVEGWELVGFDCQNTAYFKRRQIPHKSVARKSGGDPTVADVRYGLLPEDLYVIQAPKAEKEISKAVDIGPIRTDVPGDKPYWCRAPWTDSFVGFNSVDEAHKYASEFGDKNGPVYILELVYRYRVNPEDRLH